MFRVWSTKLFPPTRITTCDPNLPAVLPFFLFTPLCITAPPILLSSIKFSPCCSVQVQVTSTYYGLLPTLDFKRFWISSCIAPSGGYSALPLKGRTAARLWILQLSIITSRVPRRFTALRIRTSIRSCFPLRSNFRPTNCCVSNERKAIIGFWSPCRRPCFHLGLGRFHLNFLVRWGMSLRIEPITVPSLHHHHYYLTITTLVQWGSWSPLWSGDEQRG